MPRVAKKIAAQPETAVAPQSPAPEADAAPVEAAPKNRGGRPRKDVTQTAEFQAAVRDGVREGVEKAKAELLAALREAKSGDVPGSDGGEGDMKWARGLALAIAEMNDQGVGRKRVSPEVLVAREEARKRMINLLVEARANEQVPAYQLIGKTYLDEMFLDPVEIGPDHRPRPREIEWPGVPNYAMKPVNDVAKAIYGEFLKWTGQMVVVPGQVTDGWLTKGGLFIKGSGPRSAKLHHSEVTGEAPQTGGGAAEGYVGLKVRGRREATGQTNVLGTLHPPAMPMAS